VALGQTVAGAAGSPPVIMIPNPAAPVLWTQQNCSDMLSFLTAFANTGTVPAQPTFSTAIPNAPMFVPGSPPRISISHPAGPILWSQQNVADLLPSISAFASSGKLS
jgi:hypothetical protein